MAPKFYQNWAWHYPDALEWMQVAKQKCLATGDMSLSIGAHDKPIITLGRHASNDEILDSPYLAKNGVQVYHVDRGGGATFHGPGQIVLYPVVDLRRLHMSIPEFTNMLEQLMIDTLLAFGIEGNRLHNEPGVFVKDAKIGSIGLRVSSGVGARSILTHGLSLNVSNTLDVYKRFRSCRKDDALVTSMAKEIGSGVDVETVGAELLKKTLLLLNARAGNREAF